MISINDQKVQVPEDMTIMEAAKTAGIDIPHLCYLKDINEIGACRLCSVEVEGEERLIPACDNVVREGMRITTNSPRVRSACRTNLELIMSQHDGQCTSCVRSGNCQLQNLANEFNLLDNAFPKKLLSGKQAQWNMDFPLIRDANKCIKCMRCIQICDKVQSLKIWDLMGSGSRTKVDVAAHCGIEDADCSLCGQCITHCPVGALRERDDVGDVIAAIDDPEITTVFQIAPAVRTAWGESFGMSPREATVNRMAGALRQLGADYVFDTSFSADLTIMEEASEFLHRFTSAELVEYPMFTSCCPGWVRFLKSQYPQLVKQLSTAKSPQQMFGAVVKSYFAERIGVPADKIRCVSIMPCVAKKAECELPGMRSEAGIQDVDYVLTTRELVRMLQTCRIHPQKVKESDFDRLMGDYTGAGVIFGTTGGVMEAALRTASYIVTGKNPVPNAFHAVQGETLTSKKDWKEATFELDGAKLHIAVVNGLGNARKLCDALIRGEVHFDFVEVMACPGGCAGGGGQPIHCDDIERGNTRGKVLYQLDKEMSIRFSHENEEVQTLYQEELGKPLSERAEELLHTNHFL